MDSGRAVGFAGCLVRLCLLAAAGCSCTSGRSGDESVAAQAAATRAEEDLVKAQADSAADIARLRARAEDRVRARAADAARLPILKKRFVFEPDEIRGDGWYTHVNQTTDKSWNRCFLEVPVTASGSCYLRTRYTDDDWIFHTKLVVRIGDRVMESAEVPTYSELNVQHNRGGMVWEMLQLTEGRDNGILSAIAEADNSVPIVVRFEGGQNQKTFRLADRDRAAIKDSYELSRILEGRLSIGL